MANFNVGKRLFKSPPFMHRVYNYDNYVWKVLNSQLMALYLEGINNHFGSTCNPGAPLTCFNDGGGGEGPKEFFGPEILARWDFLAVYERFQNFFGSQKK